MFLQVDEREFATILAALRYWQRTGFQTARTATLLPQDRNTMLPRTAAPLSRWTWTRSTNFASGSIANRHPVGSIGCRAGAGKRRLR